jgi:hypothetical protein
VVEQAEAASKAAMAEVVKSRTQGSKSSSRKQGGSGGSGGGGSGSEASDQKPLPLPPPLTALQECAKQRRRAQRTDEAVALLAARVRRLWAQCAAAQDRVAVSSQRGRGGFARDAWAEGARPKHPDREAGPLVVVGPHGNNSGGGGGGRGGGGGGTMGGSKVEFPSARPFQGLSELLLVSVESSEVGAVV